MGEGKKEKKDVLDNYHQGGKKGKKGGGRWTGVRLLL